MWFPLSKLEVLRFLCWKYIKFIYQIRGFYAKKLANSISYLSDLFVDRWRISIFAELTNEFFFWNLKAYVWRT